MSIGEMEKENIKIDMGLLNKSQKEKIVNIFKTQKNDSFCSLLGNKDINIGVDDEIDYNKVGITKEEVNNITEEKDDILNGTDIMLYLKKQYPFIVTVPEKFGKEVAGDGIMTPVEPSDEPGNFGFKGTIGRDPFLEKKEKRYVIALKPHLKNKLLPFLINKKFKGVGFLPFPPNETLKKDRDYEILGLYSGEDFNKIMLKAELEDTREKIRKVI